MFHASKMTAVFAPAPPWWMVCERPLRISPEGTDATDRNMSSATSNLARVCLAISSYRNDTEILEQLESLGARLASFGRILIVDSLGTDLIPSAIAKHGWTNVDYRSFDRNLGSA